MAKKQTATEGDELVQALKDADDDQTEDTSVGEESPDSDDTDAGDDEPKKPVKPVAKNGSKKTKKSSKKVEPPADVPPIEQPSPELKDARNRKKLGLIIAGIGVVLLAAAATGYVMLGNKNSNGNENTNTSVNVNSDTTSQLVPRRIDGVLDKPDNQNKFPVAIMVENQVQARPQSGLDKANIVFEALAEGGITRFMALYTFTQPVKEIGPVRSARPYYVDWARGYDALYVHIGGSPKAYARLSSTGARDFDQFHNSQYFWRDKSRDVASEHTLYTSGYYMTLALLDKKLPTTGTYDAWKYKDDAPSADRPSSQHITINFSSFSYKVDYEYDPVTNTYVRSEAEKAHVMRDGTPLQPKNVVVLTVNRRLEQPVTDNHGRLEMDTVGQGSAQFFVDGILTKGTWKKESPQAPLQLLRQDGTPMTLDAGQTWVEMVPPDQTVTVK